MIISGKIPSSLLATYAASKAYLRSFSQALAMEVKPLIHVEHVNTYFVTTQMSKIKRTSFFAPTPKKYVQSVLATAGDSISSTPFPSHRLIEWVLDFVPEWILVLQSDVMHRDIRRRALAKQAREVEAKKST